MNLVCESKRKSPGVIGIVIHCISCEQPICVISITAHDLFMFLVKLFTRPDFCIGMTFISETDLK